MRSRRFSSLCALHGTRSQIPFCNLDTPHYYKLLHRPAPQEEGPKVLALVGTTEFDQRRLLDNFSRDSELDSMSMENSEGYTRIAQILMDGLNPKYRAAFVLREVEEKSYEDVARRFRDF